MDEVAPQVLSKLEEMGPAVSIDLNIGVEAYFDTLTALIDRFCNKKGLSCIYISVTVPSSTLLAALRSLEIDTSKLRFVDCISYATMECSDTENKQTVFVESPTMLEYIVLKTEYLLRKGKGEKFMVILDSVNSLAAHNEVRMLYEFMQVLMAGAKSREAYPICLSMEEQLKPEVREMLQLVCDQIVTLK
jgi:KaiC/GvpD/RAD55 family RecA-like ATPase